MRMLQQFRGSVSLAKDLEDDLMARYYPRLASHYWSKDNVRMFRPRVMRSVVISNDGVLLAVGHIERMVRAGEVIYKAQWITPAVVNRDFGSTLYRLDRKWKVFASSREAKQWLQDNAPKSA